MTARELIRRSLTLIGVLAEGEAPTADQQTDALSSLNDLIASWSTENLCIYANVRESFPLVSGQASYTMGTGGDFDTSRPLEIQDACIEINTSTPAIERTMEIVNDHQWAEVRTKDLTSTIPLVLHPNGTNPLETLELWPVPSATYNLILYSRKELTSIATVGTAIALPPGYDRALRFNLAMELAPEYGKAVSQEVASIAMEAKANIKRMNIKPQLLEIDQSLRSRGGFNWMTGDFE